MTLLVHRRVASMSLECEFGVEKPADKTFVLDPGNSRLQDEIQKRSS